MSGKIWREEREREMIKFCSDLKNKRSNENESKRQSLVTETELENFITVRQTLGQLLFMSIYCMVKTCPNSHI